MYSKPDLNKPWITENGPPYPIEDDYFNFLYFILFYLTS